MNKTCYFCKGDKPKESIVGKVWVEERQYIGSHGGILRRQMVGGADRPEDYKYGEPIKIIHYCSMYCMEEQNDKEEKELWDKGDCKECKKPLAVINDDCEDKEHKRLGCLLPINTPDCLKK